MDIYNECGEKLSRASKASILRSFASPVSFTRDGEKVYNMVMCNNCYLCKDTIPGEDVVYTVLVPDTPDQRFTAAGPAINYFLESLTQD